MLMDKRKGMFGNSIVAGDQPPMDMGDFGPVPSLTNEPLPIPNQMLPEKKPGFNEVGGWGEKLATIGGILANDPNNAALQPYLLKRQMALQQQRAQQARETDWQDYVRKQEYERANPAPKQPHYWETNDGSLASIGADGQPQVIYKDPTPKIDWITATNPDGTKTLVPMPQGGGAPAAPVGKLRPIGGPTAPQSGGFR